jgi:hypothetical protein
MSVKRNKITQRKNVNVSNIRLSDLNGSFRTLYP